MKLSEQSGLLSNGPIYSFLAIYMPLSMLTVLVFFLGIFSPVSQALLLASGGLSALAASFYCDFMKDVKSSRTASNIRGMVIILIIFYITASLFRLNIPLTDRLLPDLSNILASFGSVYVWVSVVSLKKLFSARRRFETYTKMYQGEQLHEALYEDPGLLQYIDEEIYKTKRNYVVQFIFIGLILLMNVVYKSSFPAAIYFMLTGILVSGICIFGFFGIIQREHYCAAEGMSLSTLDRSRHLLWIGIFSVISISMAVLLSSDKSPLPVSIITVFLSWLLKLFGWLSRLLFSFLARFFRRHTSEPVVEPEMPLFDPLPDFPEQIEESGPWPFWNWLKFGFIFLAAAGFLWFMILPVLDRVKASSGELTFFQKLGRIIAEWFRGTLTGLASFFAFVTSARKLRRYDDGEIQRTTGSVLEAYSQARKRDIKQNATLFARLILWGGEVRQVSWKPVYAPGEYCHFLTAAMPDETQLNKGIIRCGELFEKALYSAEILSDAERKEFKDMVEEITSVV